MGPFGKVRTLRRGWGLTTSVEWVNSPFLQSNPTEGGDHLRVVVRSQTDQPLDQVGGLSLWSNEGFHGLFYMKVAAPSPAFSLNPIIPSSWTSCPFQYLFCFREDGYNEQKHKVPLPSAARWGREKARAEVSDRVWANSVHASPRPPRTNSLRPRPWDRLSVALSSHTQRMRNHQALCRPHLCPFSHCLVSGMKHAAETQSGSTSGFW